MKTNILIITWLLISSAVSAQTAVDKLFDKYSGKDGFTTVYISQYMFDMFKDVQTNDQDFDNLVKGLKSIRILNLEDPSKLPAGVNFYDEVMKSLPIKDYKELMVIKEKDQNVKFLVKEENGKISELLLISGGKDNALICIQGNIDIKSIAKLSKSLSIQGMKPLENVDSKNLK